MKNSNVIGIDLAKDVIQVCKVDKTGELVLNKAVSLKKLKEVLATSIPSIVAMEGCGSCHYWGRLAEQFGVKSSPVKKEEQQTLGTSRKFLEKERMTLSNHIQ